VLKIFPPDSEEPVKVRWLFCHEVDSGDRDTNDLDDEDDNEDDEVADDEDDDNDDEVAAAGDCR
jgi:hypothetical protein